MTDDFLQGWVGTDEAVAISGYSRLTLYIKRKTGEITFKQVGRTILYSREEMERLASERLADKNEGEF